MVLEPDRWSQLCMVLEPDSIGLQNEGDRKGKCYLPNLFCMLPACCQQKAFPVLQTSLLSTAENGFSCSSDMVSAHACAALHAGVGCLYMLLLA
jgi:hypothetical protein